MPVYDDDDDEDMNPAAGGEPAAIDNLLGLKILVVFMGVLLLVCIVAFFAVLFISGTSDDPEIAEVPAMALSVAPDEEIISMALDGRDLALQIEGPRGRRIVIVNPYTADHKAVINMEPNPVVENPE